MNQKIENFAEIVKKQQEDIRKRFVILAKLYPGAFDSSGNPIVAVAALPSLRKE